VLNNFGKAGAARYHYFYRFFISGPFQTLLCRKAVSTLSQSTLIIYAENTISRSPPCSIEKWNRILSAGTYSTRRRPKSAPASTSFRALLSDLRVLIRLWDQERFAAIWVRFAITSVAKVSVQASTSRLPMCNAHRKNDNYCPEQAQGRFFLPNSLSCKSLSGRIITFFPSGSASKTVEQAGSIINSRKALCAGKGTRGKLNNLKH